MINSLIMVCNKYFKTSNWLRLVSKRVLSLMLISIVLVEVSCKSDSAKDIGLTTGVLEKSISYGKRVVLNENLSTLGRVESFDVLNDNYFVVSTIGPEKVYLYDSNGDQVREIGSFGSGPYEYSNPSYVKCHNGKIYVWCADKLKLIKFNQNGYPIEEYRGFFKAIKGFEILDDLMFYYSAGGFDGEYIEEYDLKRKNFIEDHKWGEKSEEHKMLNLLKDSGGLTSFRNEILFVSPDKLVLNRLNVNTRSMEKVRIKDSEFKVERVEGNAKNIINSDRRSALDYIGRNGVLTGVFATKNSIIITAQTGTINDKLDGGFDFSNRYDKIYVLDSSMVLKKIIKINQDFPGNLNPLSASERGIYTILETNEKLNSFYELVEIDL